MQLSAAKDDLERPAANEPLDNPCEGRGAIYGRACPSRKMVKRKERKMAEQYVEQLAAARERIVPIVPSWPMNWHIIERRRSTVEL